MTEAIDMPLLTFSRITSYFIFGIAIFCDMASATVKPVIVTLEKGTGIVSVESKKGYVGEKTDWYLLEVNDAKGLTLKAAKIAPYAWTKNECLGGFDLRISIKSPKPNKNSFMLIGGIRLKPAVLPGSFQSPEKALVPGETINLRLEQEYIIKATGNWTIEKHEKLLVNYSIELKQGEVNQVIFKPDHQISGTPKLLWAGDLDGDKRLDLIIDMSTSDEATDATLFLSSYAGKQHLVIPVANHPIEPC